MISFRLTHDEYERFRRLCVSRGLRNVSELVRSAVNQMIDETAEGSLQDLQLRVTTLESRVSDLSVAIRQAKQRPTGESGALQEPASLLRSAGR